MNPNERENQEEALLNDLINLATRKTVIGEKYDSAKSMDDLLYYVSEQFLQATVSIMLSLKGPRRSKLVLDIMKHINHEGYLAYWNRKNKLFSACLIYIIDRFRNEIKETYQIILDEEFLEKIQIQTGIIYTNYLEVDKNEESMFKKNMIESITEYENSRPIEQNDLLKKIIEAHGKEPSRDELAKFVKETLAKDPLVVIEPHSFIKNYKRLIL